MNVANQSASNTRNRKILLAIFGLTFVPILASYASYYLMKPAGGNTYGELLQTRSVTHMKVRDLNGKTGTLAEFNGHWQLLMVAPAACETRCQERLFSLRQYRLAQGAEMNRIERVWIVSDGKRPDASVIAKGDGIKVRLLFSALDLSGDTDNGVYLIDPVGNQVMRYGDGADRGKVINELGKLLKNNERLG